MGRAKINNLMSHPLAGLPVITQLNNRFWYLPKHLIRHTHYRNILNHRVLTEGIFNLLRIDIDTT